MPSKPKNMSTKFVLGVTVKMDLLIAFKHILGKWVILQKNMLGLE